MRKPVFYICETKTLISVAVTAQLISAFCICYMDNTISLLSKSEISGLQPSSVVVQPGLCGTWSETPNTIILVTWLIYNVKQET